MRVVASGLRFPEGPVAMPDGSVLVVEIERATVTRVQADGATSVVAETGGGPNGAALGPDGALYVCNNGGFGWETINGLLKPTRQAEFRRGYIQRVDLRTGAVKTLYDSCDGHPLAGPNDIVFDQHGGFYFTDLGKNNGRERYLGGIYYAQPDGSRIVEIAHPVTTPNGIGLSPDNRTLYFAESEGARVWAFDVEGPGRVKKHPFPSPHGARFICGLPGFQRFDSLGVEPVGGTTTEFAALIARELPQWRDLVLRPRTLHQG